MFYVAAKLRRFVIHCCFVLLFFFCYPVFCFVFVLCSLIFFSAVHFLFIFILFRLFFFHVRDHFFFLPFPSQKPPFTCVRVISTLCSQHAYKYTIPTPFRNSCAAFPLWCVRVCPCVTPHPPTPPHDQDQPPPVQRVFVLRDAGEFRDTRAAPQVRRENSLGEDRGREAGGLGVVFMEAAGGVSRGRGEWG